jgi:hypothetical protein
MRVSEMRFGLKNCQTQEQVVNPFINFVFIDQPRAVEINDKSMLHRIYIQTLAPSSERETGEVLFRVRPDFSL